MEGFRSGHEIWKEKELKRLDEEIRKLRDELDPYRILFELSKAEDLINEFCDKSCEIRDCYDCPIQKAYLRIAKITATVRKLDELESKWIEIYLEVAETELKDIEKFREELEEVLGDGEEK